MYDRRHYWIVTNPAGQVWPCTFSFFRTQAIEKIEASWNVHHEPSEHQSWAHLYRRGWRCVKVKLKRT